jgi:small GTP-binding protein
MCATSQTVGGKIKFKIVLLGDQCVGKSSIIDRFINEKFEESYNVPTWLLQATIGIDFLVRNMTYQGKSYRLQLWDTAGQEQFKSLIPSYLKDSDCALIVYDTMNENSLANAEKWFQFFAEHKNLQSICVLVGNKIDLRGEETGCGAEPIRELAERIKVPSFEISAKTGEGIQQLFLQVIDNINESMRKQK